MENRGIKNVFNLDLLAKRKEYLESTDYHQEIDFKSIPGYFDPKEVGVIHSDGRIEKLFPEIHKDFKSLVETPRWPSIFWVGLSIITPLIIVVIILSIRLRNFRIKNNIYP